MTKPRQSYGTDSPERDRCYTPPYAVDILIPFLPRGAVIWESACGGNHIVWQLRHHGYTVVGTDIEHGIDALSYEPPCYDIQVTNPPYQAALKNRWIEQSYLRRKPFALLMQLDTLGTSAANYFARYGVEIIIPDKRIDFFMPDAGYQDNGAAFKTVWFTHGLGIGQQLNFVEMDKPPAAEVVASVERLRARHAGERQPVEVSASGPMVEIGDTVWRQGVLV